MATHDAHRALLNREQVGKAISRLRVRYGLNQTKLAELAKVDRPSLGGIEAGRQWATFPTYDKLVKAMGASWSEFAAELDHLTAET